MVCTTLCYIEKDDKYLMLYRNKKENDINKGKWIGIGGHIKPSESKEECIKREMFEETGLICDNLIYYGQIFFHYDGICETTYLFKCNKFHGTIINCDEGELKWISKSELNRLNMWSGDKLFLSKLDETLKSPFILKIYYEKDKLISYKFMEE